MTDDEKAQQRIAHVGAMFGFYLYPVVWSNDTRQAYHPACAWGIPEGPLGTVELSGHPDDPLTQVCGSCGMPLDPSYEPPQDDGC